MKKITGAVPLPHLAKCLLTLLLLLVAAGPGHAQKPIRVACVGNSITYGYGLAHRDSASYPAQLQRMLGKNYEVGNFGKSGATLIARAYRPYFEQEEYRQALAFRPDLVVIHLGINDTDPRSWPCYQDDFMGDFRRLIDSFREVNPRCKIWVCRLTPISDRHPRFKSGTRDWRDEISRQTDLVAETNNTGIIDLFEPLYHRPDLFPDGLHPDAEGAGIIATQVYRALTGDMGGLSLPAVYTDHMVLQRDRPVTLRGTADAHHRVMATLDGETLSAVAGADGRWEITLKPQPARTDVHLVISSGNQERVFHNVAFGDVWLCSGQSNMAFTTTQLAPDERRRIMEWVKRRPNVRLCNMKPRYDTDDTEWDSLALHEVNRLRYYDCKAWQQADSLTVLDFSAIALSFARDLSDSLRVPIGLICNAVGGSDLFAWIDRWHLEHLMPDVLADPSSSDFYMPWVRSRMARNLGRSHSSMQRHPYLPAYLHEAGMLPLRHHDLRGLLWYQGESDAHNPDLYGRSLPLLRRMADQTFGKTLPIYAVQLSAIDRPSWGRMRNVQRLWADDTPGVYMAVSSDLGDSLDVHPVHKEAIGRRLARLVLHHEFGRRIVPSGPMFRGIRTDGRAALVSFDHGKGMAASDGRAIRGFEIAGRDEIYHPATATPVADGILRVASPEVPRPLHVRYAWQPFTRANLVNSDGLPASTFHSLRPR